MHLPKQRKLTEAEKSMAFSFLEMGANKKLLQEKLMRDTNKIVLLKDLANIEQRANSGNKNDLKLMVDKLKSKYKCVVKLLSDSDSNFLGIFFQDKEMKAVFDSYPEIVCLDATYKLTALRFPLCLFLVEDSLGLSEICGAALLANEEEDTLRWMLGVFKEENLKSSEVRAFMTDKDITERQLIGELFENASLLICLFHTLRSFKREVSVKKMGITQGQVDTYHEILQRMAYSKNENEYEGHKNELMTVAPVQVREYFLNNWDLIRDEWVHFEKSKQGNYLNSTNNRLESINQKLKSVITKFSTLDKFTDRFFTIVSSMRTERDHIASRIIQTRKVRTFTSSTISRYAHFLTPYAITHMDKQYSWYLANVQRQVSKLNDESFQVPSSEGDLTCTPTSCTCSFRSSMLLPCRHIFLVRHLLHLDEFDMQLCCQRWHLSYFQGNARVLHNNQNPNSNISNSSTNNNSRIEDIDEESISSQIDSIPRMIGSTVQKRFRQAKVITDQIADIVSESTGADFESHMSILRSIHSSLSSGSPLTVDISPCELRSTLIPGTSEPTEVARTSVDHPENPVPAQKDPNLFVPATAGSPVMEPTMHSQKSDFNDITILSLKLPSARAPKGRPKGAQSTVIGLNRKRKNQEADIRPFCKKHMSEKKIEILSWFVGMKVAAEAINERKNVSSEDLISIDSQKLLLCSQEDAIDLRVIRPFTEPEAYKFILKKVVEHADDDILCASCYHAIDVDEASQKCSSCLSSHHLPCIDRVSKVKNRYWYCQKCTESFEVKKGKSAQCKSVQSETKNRLITTSNENENDKNEMAEVESTQPETKTDSAQFSGKMTLRKLAQQLYPSSSEESEDEDCPNDRFVEMLHEMHNDGILLPLVQQGVDVERNPLMVMNSGSVHSVDIEKFAKEFPTFHKQLTSMRKRLGSFGYLSKFLRTHYHESLHSVSSTCLSQIEYVQLAVQNLISDN